MYCEWCLQAFSKKMVEERKDWLTNFMEERKRRAQLELPDVYLYGKDTTHVSYNEFVNRELILFSNMDVERSIPSLCDGETFTCLSYKGSNLISISVRFWQA